jgi:hypothetical protein
MVMDNSDAAGAVDGFVEDEDGITSGVSTITCATCSAIDLPIGPCAVRRLIEEGHSQPNARVCPYSTRLGLNVDLYPPFDIPPKISLSNRLTFTPRSEGVPAEYDYRIRDGKQSIRLTVDDLRRVSSAFDRVQVVVLKAPTGYGKSTLLPYWLAWHPISRFEKFPEVVLVAEPKRIAAELLANTVSKSHQGSVPGYGQDVGLHHGQVSARGESNKLVYVTDGSLVQQLTNFELDNVQLLVIDEAHERNERIEISLLILAKLLPLYPNLKLLILSATISPTTFLEYFERFTVEGEAIELADVAKLEIETIWPAVSMDMES